MPPRRPSASTSHVNPTQSTFRGHRSNVSRHVLDINSLPQPPSIAYSAASATPQQKIVQALINRTNNKVRTICIHGYLGSRRSSMQLPLHSGMALDIVEADPATQSAVEALVELSHDSLDIIAYSLCELLERLAKVRSRRAMTSPHTNVITSKSTQMGK